MTFEEALGELLEKFTDEPTDKMIAAMEMRLDQLYDAARFEATGSQVLPQD